MPNRESTSTSATGSWTEYVRSPARTRRSGAGAELGGFGGLFDLKAAGFVDPILVAANDGVGTKLKIAVESGATIRSASISWRCASTTLSFRARSRCFSWIILPLANLTRRSCPPSFRGIAEGCAESGCALIGGETAEMPGLYAPGDFDIAGFAVGAAERGTLLPRPGLKPGDLVFGLPSSGVHSNGFSLVRRIVARSGLGWDAPAPFDPARSLAAALLTPTRLYVRPLLQALKKTRGILALAHITGGGYPDNLPRVLDEGLAVSLDLNAFTPQPVFVWLASAGDVDEAEMLRTFNCGFGIAAFVSADLESRSARGPCYHRPVAGPDRRARSRARPEASLPTES